MFASESEDLDISATTQAILDAAIRGDMDSFTPEQLIAAREEAEMKLNPLRIRSKDSLEGKQYANVFIGNLARDYQQALAITSVVAYVFRMAEEHFTKDAAMYADAPAAKANVLKFLNHFFEYNPDLHVSEMRKTKGKKTTPATKAFEKHCADVRECIANVDKYEADLAAQKATLAEAQAALVEAVNLSKEDTDAGRAAKNTIENKLTAVQLQELQVKAAEKTIAKARRAVDTQAAYDKKLPYDFYYWFSAYFRSNYDALREATSALWPVRSDMDEVIIVYDTSKDEETAKSRRMKLASERVPINTIPMGVPVFYGPTKENTTNVEFTGAGQAVFREMIEHHKREAAEGNEMLSHISKVRSRREGIAPADPNEVGEFAQFCSSLRAAEGKRELTTAEKQVLEEEASGAPDREVQRRAIHDIREERQKAEIEDIMESAPEGTLATQIVGTNPDTGEFKETTIYIDSEEKRAEDAANRLEEPAEVIVQKKE